MEFAINTSRDQTIASIIERINNLRKEDLVNILKTIDKETVDTLNSQDELFIYALAQVEKVKEFITDKSHILGSDRTKHGEIAEQIDVHIRNAIRILKGKTPDATFEGVGRTAPEDYIINGMQVQSKFINGANNTLDHVIKHMKSYEYFGRDDKSYYQIPKDLFETIEKIRNGKSVDGLNEKSIRAVLKKIEEIERMSNKSFEEAVKPSISGYKEVQLGKVDETLQNHEMNLDRENESIKNKIKEDSEVEKSKVQESHKPSVNEGLKAGAIGAAIGGGTNVVVCIYKKYKQGKDVFNFDIEDWKDVGIDFGKGAAKGGVSAVSIYALTNLTKMPAPLAGAYVSASFGVAKLYKDYKQEKITLEELVEQSEILCFETGLVTLGSVVGQAIIPIPIVGSIVGCLTTNAILTISKQFIDDNEKELAQILNKKYKQAMDVLGENYKKLIEDIMKTYRELGGLTKLAFDFNANTVFRFDASEKLALSHGVEESKILKSLDDVDSFFLN